MPQTFTVQPQFITVVDFVRMMGRTSRQWYYDHRSDPGMPQAFKGPGGSPMLDYAECIAYAERFKPKKAADVHARPRWGCLLVTPAVGRLIGLGVRGCCGRRTRSGPGGTNLPPSPASLVLSLLCGGYRRFFGHASPRVLIPAEIMSARLASSQSLSSVVRTSR